MKIMFLSRSKHWIFPEIKYFPATYRDGQIEFFADLRITFPWRTVHIIFNRQKKHLQKEKRKEK